MLLSSLIVLTTTGPFKLEPKEKYKTKCRIIDQLVMELFTYKK